MDCLPLNLLATLFLHYDKVIKPFHSETLPFTLDPIEPENFSGLFVRTFKKNHIFVM